MINFTPSGEDTAETHTTHYTLYTLHTTLNANIIVGLQ